MEIFRVHPITKKLNKLELDITEEEYRNWHSGELIQNVMPKLTSDEREFLISGLLPGEFDRLIPDEDGEDDYNDDIAFLIMEKLTEEESILINSLLNVAYEDNEKYYYKTKRHYQGLENLGNVLNVAQELIEFKDKVESIKNKLKQIQ